MCNEIIINLEEKKLDGDVLDIGFSNYGIVYNIYKCNNQNFQVEYIKEEDKINSIEKGIYDSCVLFLSFSGIMFKAKRKSLLEKICAYLKEDGVLHIWDINKGYGKVFSKKIKVIFPDKKSKEISVNDMNIFKDTSKEGTVKLLNQNFHIIDCESLDYIYYIKAQKKRRDCINETKSDACRD